MKKQCVLMGIVVAGALVATDAFAQHKAPNQQPPQATEATAPTGDVTLGSIRLPRAVTADGKPLAAGTYTVRLTTQEAGPNASGITEPLERWVEFVQGGAVKGERGRDASCRSRKDKMVVKDAAPPAGGSKVQMLRGNDFVRVWFNKGGNHYLIYLPVSGGAAGN